jgi:hypothetical protein
MEALPQALEIILEVQRKLNGLKCYGSATSSSRNHLGSAKEIEWFKMLWKRYLKL